MMFSILAKITLFCHFMAMKRIALAFCLSCVTALQAEVWKERPADFEPRFEIAACFLEREDGQLLFLHRLDNKSQGNTWGIPGGKVDKGETTLQAVVREIKEETGIALSSDAVKPIGSVYITNTVRNKVSYVYHMFRTKYTGSRIVSINPEEHKGFTWVTPCDALNMQLMDDEDACILLVYPELAAKSL
ncbi:MAG: NUDIX hydrolase [Parachlamydia sp.]|nr:NUDIX hydrolase [Parachlamydia sp.]